MQNIYAYTENTNPYPPFVSLNKQSDGRVTLMVRAPAGPGPYSDKDCGKDATIEIPRDELLRLFEALRKELTPPMMAARGLSI